MQSEEAVRDALRVTARDLEHLEELREMRTLNQGFSEIRNRALGEVERLIQERRETLLWVLQNASTDEAGESGPPALGILRTV